MTLLEQYKDYYILKSQILKNPELRNSLTEDELSKIGAVGKTLRNWIQHRFCATARFKVVNDKAEDHYSALDKLESLLDGSEYHRFLFTIYGNKHEGDTFIEVESCLLDSEIYEEVRANAIVKFDKEECIAWMEIRDSRFNVFCKKLVVVKIPQDDALTKVIPEIFINHPELLIEEGLFVSPTCGKYKDIPFIELLDELGVPLPKNQLKKLDAWSTLRGEHEQS